MLKKHAKGTLMSRKAENPTRHDHVCAPKQARSSLSFDRRTFITGIAGTTVLATLDPAEALAQAGDPVNLAKAAQPSSSVTMSENKISTLNDGFIPASSRDRQYGAYAVRPDYDFDTLEWKPGSARWVQYDWVRPVAINKVDLYWAVDPVREDDPPGSNSMARMCPPEVVPHPLLGRR